MVENTTHCFGVRHYDVYGGVSSEVTLTVTASATKPTAPDLIGIGIEIINPPEGELP